MKKLQLLKETIQLLEKGKMNNVVGGRCSGDGDDDRTEDCFTADCETEWACDMWTDDCGTWYGDCDDNDDTWECETDEETMGEATCGCGMVLTSYAPRC